MGVASFQGSRFRGSSLYVFTLCSKLEEEDEMIACHCLEMGHFYCLPNEILYFILSFLPIQDIISISLTSSQMNSAIKLFAFSPPGVYYLRMCASCMHAAMYGKF